MNSAIRSNFKVVFMKKVVYRSCEQCTRLIKKMHSWKMQNALPKEAKKNILVIECVWVHACVNGKENISNDANLQ